MKKLFPFFILILCFVGMLLADEDRQTKRQRRIEAMQRNCYDRSNANQANTCNDLGTMYFSGDGVKRDLDKAAQYYGKACESGQSPDSCKVYDQILQMMQNQK